MANKAQFQTVTGMQDILPRDRRFFEFVEKKATRLASYYGYERIETPILEYSELFEKGTGQGSDIVQKQMYSLKTDGGDLLTLRPEFTPSIVRAYIQHGMAAWPQPVKVSAFGPVFRHERPQAERYREFRQFELDSIGEKDPVLDVQIILLFYKILHALGIQDLSIQVNSIGCSRCKPNYRRVLRDYYRGRERSLCKDCRRRIKINLLRVLDCKDEKCERLKSGAPTAVDYLCVECHNHFRTVLEIFDSMELPYLLSPHLVRGLDYYTKTVFEIFPEGLEESSAKTLDKDKKKEESGEASNQTVQGEEGRVVALASGGRFDDLIGQLGGEDAPAVGGAMGVERVVSQMRKLDIRPPQEKPSRVFFVHLGDLAKRKGLKIMEDLRAAGIGAREALGKGSIRAQMEVADKQGMDYSVILGHQEVTDDTIIIRDMRSGSQEVIPLGKVVRELKKRLAKK